MSDWLKTLGTAAASPIGKAAIGSVVAGALAPDAPDAPNLGTGGTGTGTSGNTQSLLDQQQAVSQEYLDWLKSENEWLKPYIQNQLDTGKQASSLQLDAAGKLSGMADTMWQDYQTKFRPVEDKMISDAMNYDSEGAQAKAAARATGEIDKQLSNSRQETAARMASMGIDPSSGRYASAAGTQDLYAAAQKASAATSARDTVKNTGITLRQSAANFGADKAKTSGTLTGLGASAAGAAATTAGAGISSGTQAASLPGSGYTSVINSIGNKVNQANTDSKNALTLYDARMRNYQDELQGIGSLVGAALDTFGYYSTRP